MKVLQINAVCGGGSTGRIVRELNDSLVLSGHQGMVAFGNGGSDYEHAVRVSGKYGVKLHGVLSRITGKNAAFSPLATARIIRIIKKYAPDVVHLHNLHGNYVNLGSLLRFLAKKDIPTVITLHDCWFFTGKCTHYTAAGCYKWHTGCEGCPQLKKDIPSWFFDRTRRMWSDKKRLFSSIRHLAVIGVSDWITNEGKRSFLKDAKIIKRIYNWIDLDVFYPREANEFSKYGVREDEFTVFCISGGWRAGTSKLCDLIAFAEAIGDSGRIILAGNVDETVKLPANVVPIGYVNSTDELARLYSCADAYVHLSREDTFGKVIAEAMACGTPAVVYNSTACPEIVGGGCGYKVDTGDVSALVSAALRIKEDGKRAYSEKCVAFVRESFEKNKLIDETLELYKALCDFGEYK